MPPRAAVWVNDPVESDLADRCLSLSGAADLDGLTASHCWIRARVAGDLAGTAVMLAYRAAPGSVGAAATGSRCAGHAPCDGERLLIVDDRAVRLAWWLVDCAGPRWRRRAYRRLGEQAGFAGEVGGGGGVWGDGGLREGSEQALRVPPVMITGIGCRMSNGGRASMTPAPG